MQRFFEVSVNDADKFRTLWELPENANIGPVNTNYPECPTILIRLVVVCESPSLEEVERGFPTVGSTGRKIYYALRSETGKDKSNLYDFDTCYKEFERQGVYLTNLVHFRADYDVKGEVSIKNKRVKDAWPLCKNYLKSELTLIAKNYPKVPVLFACGTAFNKEVREAVSIAKELKLTPFVTGHPSRALNQNIMWNYQPEQWYGKACWPHERKKADQLNDDVQVVFWFDNVSDKNSFVKRDERNAD